MPFIHLDIPQLVQIIGYPGIITAIFLESGVFFGFFLPGGSLLFTSGVLAGTGIFNPWILIPLVIAAAIAGDNVGYWFGAKVGRSLFKREDSRFFKKKHLEQTQEFFRKYGKATIILGRFVPIVRTFAPILAGVGSMEYRLFFFYNALGGVIWAGGITLVGYFLGSIVPHAEKYLLPIVLVIIISSLIPLVFEWWRRHKPIRECPRAVIFDLDNTLAESFKVPTPATAHALTQLLAKVPVAVMSGATFERIDQYLLSALHSDAKLSNLYLFPDTASRAYTYKDGSWHMEYNKAFSKEEFDTVVSTLEDGIKQTRICEGTQQYGERILARENQVTLAAIGIDASAELKASWDPDRRKRNKLRRFLKKRLRHFDVRVSGRTAIDITHKGVDKALGVKWLAEHLDILPTDMLFVGDDLGRGGNDAMVIPTGIHTREVSGPTETAKVLEELLTLCKVESEC